MTGKDMMTTFRRADGECIDDYSFVDCLDWFDDYSEPTELVEEVWECVSRRIVVAPDPGVCTFDVDGDWCEEEPLDWMKDGDEWVPRCYEHLTGPRPADIEAKAKAAR